MKKIDYGTKTLCITKKVLKEAKTSIRTRF